MTTLSRRDFVAWSSVAAGATALSGFTSTAFAQGQAYDTDVDAAKSGEWKVVPCYNNCSCDSSRCLLKCYFEDGVPLKIRSDEEGDDRIEMPQRRACLRGRAAIKDKLSPMRLKYPMKRKNWSPDNPHGELRGIDEWERISWDEALDYVAAEIQKCLQKYGPHSMLSCTEMSLRNCTWDAVYSLFNYLGAMTNVHGEISWGAWNAPTSYMTGAENNLAAPDALTFSKTKLHIMFGNNWAVNKSGLAPYQMQYAKEQGARMIFIDPWYNRTAQAFADEWIPVLPGTDGALALGVAYHQIENGLYNQEYLDKYCIGFDADHMPEGADAKDNFKDYVLGTYTGEPRTPEWAEAICGVPAAKIRELAEEIASEEHVGFFGGMSTTKHPAGEQFAQAMYTLAFMRGTVGREGSYVSWQGLCDSGISSMAAEGACMGGGDIYPDKPEPKPQHYPTRVNSCIDVRNPGNEDWAMLDMSTQWQEILDGEYGNDKWPGGKRKIDVHLIHNGGVNDRLNAMPNVNAGIKAWRKMDFVFTEDIVFSTSAQYSDIVLPAASLWEKMPMAWTYAHDIVYWNEPVMKPLFESKPETWIADELCRRMGIDPKKVNALTEQERAYVSLAGSKVMLDAKTGEMGNMFTITQADLDDMGVEGTPQEGQCTLADFKERGFFTPHREFGDALMNVPYKNYYDDPEGNPVGTESGKFEIYCSKLADMVSAYGYTELSPIAKWQTRDDYGANARNSEYPLVMWTPHSLARAHGAFRFTPSLREAFPQSCFMSKVDADERGIKSGDKVLMTSRCGKVLRLAQVMPGIIPGAVALNDGGKVNIDPETGIDLGGCPNVLQDPPASGEGYACWTGTLIQVEKYDGQLELGPDKEAPFILPVGIEE